MKEKRLTQTQQVINTLREQGGYATLGNLYHLVDTSTWATKTPNESIRRIVNGESTPFTCFITGTDLLIDGGVIAAIRTGEYQLG
jgi:hypothetical protein